MRKPCCDEIILDFNYGDKTAYTYTQMTTGKTDEIWVSFVICINVICWFWHCISYAGCHQWGNEWKVHRTSLHIFYNFPCIHNYFKINSLKSQEGPVYSSCRCCWMWKIIQEKQHLCFLVQARLTGNCEEKLEVEHRTEAVLSVARIEMMMK